MRRWADLTKRERESRTVMHQSQSVAPFLLFLCRSFCLGIVVTRDLMPRSAAVPYIARKALLLRLYLKSQPKVSTKRGKRVTTYFTYGIPLQSSASSRAWTQTLYACGPCSSWLANSAGTNLLSPVALPTWDVRDARARQGGRGLCPTLATDDPGSSLRLWQFCAVPDTVWLIVW